MYGKLFLPALGWRETTGPLTRQDVHAVYWSSTHESNTRGYYFAFDITDNWLDFSSSKAYGYSVRCVRYEIKGSDERATKVVVVFLACSRHA